MDTRIFAWALAIAGAIGTGADAVARNLEFGPYLAAGYDHVVVADPKGDLRVWGRNDFGQLGLGYVSGPLNAPTEQTSLGSGQVLQVTFSGRGDHSFAVTQDGRLLGWGRNDYGQLGLGHNAGPMINPVEVSGTIEWRTVATGRYHTVGIKLDGTLWGWGRNQSGQVGDNSTVNKFSPVPISSASDWIAVAAGEDFSLGLRSDGTLYAWGSNANNRLGLNNTNITRSVVPTPIPGHSEFVKMAAGFNSCIALKGNGTVWTWGSNNVGQLGRTGNTNAPGQVGTGSWRDISIGGEFCHAIRSDGRLYGWGRNGNGQLGIGSTLNQSAPAPVGSDRNYLSVMAGDKFAVAMKADGTLHTWGVNNLGQLGNGNSNQVTAPARIFPNSGDPYTGLRQGVIAAARYHSMAIRSDGTLWGWGSNDFGRAGLGSIAVQTTPKQVGTANNWLSVAVGEAYSLAVKADGTLWGWGDNSDSQLQGPPTADQLTPKQLTLAGDGWVKVEIGATFTSFGLKADGSLWTWGGLSDGLQASGANGSTPIRFGGTDKRWVSISVGYYHAQGITADGQLWAWGTNLYGQIGDNTTINRPSVPVPVRVTPGSTDRQWVSVSASNGSTNALRANGTMWGWGRNSIGETALGSASSKLLPTPITYSVGGAFAKNEWRILRKSPWHQHAGCVGASGGLFMWGWNDNGQFGASPSSLPDADEPTLLKLDTRNLSVGLGHTFLVDRVGDLYATGKNNEGQLGDGTQATVTHWIYIMSMVR